MVKTKDSNFTELVEDSYDDVDYVDACNYYDKEDDENTDLDRFYDTRNEKEEDSEEGNDDYEDIDDPSEITGHKYEKTATVEYGSVKGIREYADETFDEEKARKWFYEGNEKDQIESLLYAQYFARSKRVCRAAHAFIMRILTKDKDFCKSQTVYECAQTSFYYFFRTYLLRECQKFAESRNVAPGDRHDYIEEAMQNCLVFVYSALPKYDVDSGFAVSTYFQPFIKDALTSFESIKKGRSSKSTMRTDAVIVNAQKELLAEGIIPTPVFVALRTKRKVEETANSMARIKAENTMISKDANELIISGKKQDTFLEPDKSVIQEEQTEELMNALRSLNPDQRTVLCYTLGIEYDEQNHMIVYSDDGKLSLKQIAEKMDLDIGEVKALHVQAKRELETKMRSYMRADDEDVASSKKDTFLKDRHMIFSYSKEDTDMMEFIGDIDKIEDCGFVPDAANVCK